MSVEAPCAGRRAAAHRRESGSRGTFATTALAAIALVSCGESGSGGGSGGAIGAPPGTDGGLTGRIVFAGTDELEWIDLATGRVEPVPDDATFSRRETATGEFAEVEADEVLIVDASGAVNAAIAVVGPDPDWATLSPSAGLVAYVQRLYAADGFTRAAHVSFARRDGTDLGYHGPCHDVEWLPDDTALMACEDSIRFVDPESGAAPDALADFPPGARPNYLVLGPSGTRFAFELGDREVADNDVFRMDADRSVLQLVAGGLNTDGPSWSPDGRWIAFRKDIPYAAIRNGIPFDGCPTLWVVASDVASTVDLEAAASGGDRRAFELRQAPDEDGNRFAVCAWSEPLWVP